MGPNRALETWCRVRGEGGSVGGVGLRRGEGLMRGQVDEMESWCRLTYVYR